MTAWDLTKIAIFPIVRMKQQGRDPQPDGQVIPCQSYYEALGDFLTAPWSAIWEHPLALSLRLRKDVPQACKTCDFFIECGGGCPLAREHQNPQPIYRDLVLRRS